MNMTTMRMYCPSLKENVEATITDGKQVASKGGSLRNIIYGEFEGKKCLPKTVKADVFAQHGFKAESVIIHGEKEGRKTKPVAHKVGIEEKDGFVPNRINIPSTMNPPYTVETSSLKTGVFENHAENSEKMNQFDAERTLKGVQINRKNKNRSTLTYRDVDGILYKTNREWILKIDSRNIKTDVDSFAKGLEAFKRHIDMNISNIGYDAETFEAYEDQISERQEYKINSLGGKIDASMNRSDASDYIKKLMGKQSGTWKEAESSPSSFDISWEDAQGVSSPSLPPEGIHFAEQGDYRMNGEGCEYCAETRELNAEGFCSECASHAESFSASSYEDAFFTETVSEMAAEGISRNGKLALSLTALGIGVAMALGSDNVSSLLDKITRK